MKSKIAVFTGTRAEYGLLRPVLLKMLKSEVIEPLVCVTGAHLSPALGNTVNEIQADGIPIAARIDILKYSSDSLQTAKIVAFAINLFSEWLEQTRPCAIMLLGDRYEAFAAASSAAMLGIPIIHISGGDVTSGAADEFYRHSITKMSKLHFPSCRDSARRVVQLGESPDSVYCVGGLGDENLRTMKYLSIPALSKSIGVSLDNRPYLLVTYHPETASDGDVCMQMQALLDALAKLNLLKIFTKANADSGGEVINAMLDKYCAEHVDAIAFASLGSVRYLSAMKHAAAIVGNSSSGVVETPTLGVPCVNIGTRQKGRLITRNIICCKAGSDEIFAAVKRAISPAFSKSSKYIISPYYGGGTSRKIVKRCEDFVQSAKCTPIKSFYDIKLKDEFR